MNHHFHRLTPSFTDVFVWCGFKYSLSTLPFILHIFYFCSRAVLFPWVPVSVCVCAWVCQPQILLVSLDVCAQCVRVTVKSDSASMSFFYLPCFPEGEYHNSLMSSSSLQILAGVSAWLRVPRTQSCFAALLLVCASVCAFVLTCMAGDEVLSKYKDKTEEMHTHTVAGGGWNALGKFFHFAPQPCELIRKLLISRCCGGLLSRHRYTCSSWMGTEWGRPEREQG